MIVGIGGMKKRTSKYCTDGRSNSIEGITWGVGSGVLDLRD